MESKRKMIAIILILAIISNLITGLFTNMTYASSQTISADIDSLDETKYPGIKEKIKELKEKYPNWNFKILYTDIEWNEVIANEYTGHGNSPRNQVQATYKGEWLCPCGHTIGGWSCASETAIKYMMDPRNFINETDIFQFEELTISQYDKNQIEKMIAGTFLETQAEAIINSAEITEINPYFIIARLIQEQGKKGTPLTSGEYGYYNPFNIQANGNDPIINGVVYAQTQGWDTLEKGITGGINFLSKEYIKRGQNTLYLQKFDVENTYQGMYWHQYMQNIMAARNEGKTLKSTYESVNGIPNIHTFIIPVYENMPQEQCKEPNSSSNATVTGDLVKVNVNSTLCLRESPNGTKLNSLLYKDEIVTRIEKATTKIDGTYWDKIRKADGTEAYVARETYDYEAQYKLYLVPVEQEEPEDTNNSKENGSEVKIPENNSGVKVPEEQPENNYTENKVKKDEEQNIILVVPDAIAQDILDFYSGSVKIVKADGSYLEGPQTIMCTGFVIEDKYTVIKKGDCNGDGKTDTADLLAIQKQLLSIENMETVMQSAADINNDGKIDTADLLAVQKKLLNIAEIKIY